MLAVGMPDRPRLAERSLGLYARAVCTVLSSTAPAGTYTLGHLVRCGGGRGMADALRTVVGNDSDTTGRSTVAPAVAPPPSASDLVEDGV